MEKARKAMAFGTFDILHPGHVHYLHQARKLAEKLVVVVARNETVRKIKKRPPVNDEKMRAGSLRTLGIADKVILGNPGNKHKVIVDERPDLICLGYDQKSFTSGIEENLKKHGIDARIVRLPAYMPEVYKSSKLLSARSKNIK